MKSPLEIMEAYAWALVGTPYFWGGDDPMQGFDCSGVTQEILRSVGEDPPGDQNAQAYFDYFRTRSRQHVSELGSLAFYGKSARLISHVGFCISNLCFVEAGGGDSTTKSRERAIAQNAFVKPSPIFRRADLVMVMRPIYAFEKKAP